MTKSLYAAVALLALSAAAPAFARATADDAKALAEKASAYIAAVGEQKAFSTFNAGDAGFRQGELYVFCYAPDGTSLAYGANPGFVGKNLAHVKYAEGPSPSAAIIQTGLAKGEGWVSFKWPNPVTREIEDESAYVKRVNNEVCGVGYYK